MLPPPAREALRRRGCASWQRWKHDSKLVAMQREKSSAVHCATGFGNSCAALFTCVRTSMHRNCKNDFGTQCVRLAKAYKKSPNITVGFERGATRFQRQPGHARPAGQALRVAPSQPGLNPPRGRVAVPEVKKKKSSSAPRYPKQRVVAPAHSQVNGPLCAGGV